MEVAITGGSGFIGQHLIPKLLDYPAIDLRLLHRTRRCALQNQRVASIIGDLQDRGAIRKLLTPGCTVVNLAYLPDSGREENLSVVRNLGQLCDSAGIKRLVHVSTAVVAGDCGSAVVTEETVARPVTEYEKTKLEIENVLWEIATNKFELLVLRPTAILGRGGRNLLQLAGNLQNGNRLINYVRSCLYNHRRMNLVPVSTVVAALVAGVMSEHHFRNDIVQVSCDNDPGNNYRVVEKRLTERMQIRNYRIPRIPLPGWVLAKLARLAGKNRVYPDRIYASERLAWLGVDCAGDLGDAIDSFADWYQVFSDQQHSGTL